MSAASLPGLAAALVAATLLTAGCGGSATGDGAAKLGTACPTGLPGADLVFIPAGDTPFCIDARETNQRDYGDFVKAADPASQSAGCANNTSFDPVADPNGIRELAMACSKETNDPVIFPDYSVKCVNWCDAKAYCEWAGKRLCRGLGGAELDIYATSQGPDRSEWYYACSAGGMQAYPYGPEYVPGRCVDGNSPPPNTVHSRGSLDCHGSQPPYDEIFDMAGNLSEWMDSGDGEYGGARGGSASGGTAACGTWALRSSTLGFPAVGVRCCADAI